MLSALRKVARALKRRLPICEQAVLDAFERNEAKLLQTLLERSDTTRSAIHEQQASILAALAAALGRIEPILESVRAKAMLTRADQTALSSRFRCVEFDGIRIYVDTKDQLVSAGIVAGGYDSHLSAAMRRTVRAGDTVLDIGANLGYFTLMAASLVGPAGHVIAFEPQPDNVAMLRLSLCENRFHNVTIHQLAVADVAQEFKFKPDAFSSLAHVVEASRNDEVDDGRPFFPVRAVALDEILADLARVDVMKIDIDGNEVKAFRGMRTLLARCRPVLFCEFNPNDLRVVGRIEPVRLLEEIYSQGYELSVLNADGTCTLADGIDAIVAAQKRMGIVHIDLVGRPKEAHGLRPAFAA